MPFFAAARGGRRERSGSDVLWFVVSLGVSLVLGAVAVPPSGFESALVELIDEVPPALDILWRLGVASLVVWVVAVTVVAAGRRRGEVLADIVVTALVALAGAVLTRRLLEGQWPSVSAAATGGSTGSVPLVALLGGAAVAFAASPHLSQPFRRLGRWCVWGAAGSVTMLGSTTPTGALLSVLGAVAAASVVHLVLGSRAGRPSLGEVAAALADVDLDVVDLNLPSRQSSGVLVVRGTHDGDPVLVKVYGRDARDTQVLSRAWRSAWYRDAAPLASSRRQQVEHEGFMTLLAERRGVAVSHVVVAGETRSRDALVVISGRGTALSELDRDCDRPLLDAVWSTIMSLHDAGMSHGSLTPDSFRVVDGSVELSGLSSARVAPSEDEVRVDLAQTLVSTAVVVGIERAVVAAADTLGEHSMIDLLAYLQVPAMGPALRRAVKGAGLDLDALRSAAAGVVGADEPEMAQLRRVSPRTLLAVGLLVLVAFGLISALGEVDPAEILATLRSGDPEWLLLALVLAQLPFLSQAVATRGACPRPLPYGPVVLLQVSIGFIALAVPSTAGRLALDIRFFQRQGVPAASALSIAAIDGFSGFLVQISLLLATLVFGVGSVEMNLAIPGDVNVDRLLTLLGILAGVLVVAAVLAVALGRIRRRIIARVRPLATEVLQTFRGLRSVGKLVQLLGGSLANQLLFAVALGAVLVAFGGRLNLATLVVVYVAAALFGGMMPVPGGIGVMEAAIMTGLIAAGVDGPTATATALVFRIFTFYLPPLWGWLAMGWLRRHSYL